MDKAEYRCQLLLSIIADWLKNNLHLFRKLLTKKLVKHRQNEISGRFYFLSGKSQYGIMYFFLFDNDLYTIKMKWWTLVFYMCELLSD